MSDDWKHVIWSDESSFTLFPTSGRVYVWRTPKVAYKPECLVPTVKLEGGSVMIRATISWYSAGPIITYNSELLPAELPDLNIISHWVIFGEMCEKLIPSSIIFQATRCSS
jgi:hypothetical protein